jgi:type IV secretion system protein VirB8
MEALDKHNLANFVRAREGYSWMFLQRDFDQVARMAVPAVFADYNRQFEGDAALQKKIGAAEDWRINVVGVRLAASGRAGNRGEATVTYDKVVRLASLAVSPRIQQPSMSAHTCMRTRLGPDSRAWL